MTKSILKISILSLLAVALTGLPGRAQAQDHQKPAAEKKETKEKNSKVVPFNGKLKAVDNRAKTIAVGGRVFQITSETRISKDGKPATLEDGVVGEKVSGAYHKTEAGKLNATVVNFGVKAAKEKPKQHTAPSEQ